MEHLSFHPCARPDVYDWSIDTLSILDSIPQDLELRTLLENEAEGLDVELSDIEMTDFMESLGYSFRGRDNTYNYETDLGFPLIESVFETPSGGVISLIHAQERAADPRNWGSYGELRVYSWDYQEDRFEALPQFRKIHFWDNEAMELLSRSETQDRLDEAGEENVSLVDEQGSGLMVGSVERFTPEISF